MRIHPLSLAAQIIEALKLRASWSLKAPQKIHWSIAAPIEKTASLLGRGVELAVPVVDETAHPRPDTVPDLKLTRSHPDQLGDGADEVRIVGRAIVVARSRSAVPAVLAPMCTVSVPSFTSIPAVSVRAAVAAVAPPPHRWCRLRLACGAGWR